MRQFSCRGELIPYLGASHYFGIDARLALLEVGYAREIEPAGLAGRFPRANCTATSDFDLSGFGVRFDYGIAQSVFTHMPIGRLDDCLRAIGRISTLVAAFMRRSSWSTKPW